MPTLYIVLSGNFLVEHAEIYPAVYIMKSLLNSTYIYIFYDKTVQKNWKFAL